MYIEITQKQFENYEQHLTNTINYGVVSPFSYSCLIQDEQTLEEIQNIIGDYNITACMFTTYTGDYENIFVQYGQPSYHSHIMWFHYIPDDIFTVYNEYFQYLPVGTIIQSSKLVCDCTIDSEPKQDREGVYYICWYDAPNRKINHRIYYTVYYDEIEKVIHS